MPQLLHAKRLLHKRALGVQVAPKINLLHMGAIWGETCCQEAGGWREYKPSMFS